MKAKSHSQYILPLFQRESGIRSDAPPARPRRTELLRGTRAALRRPTDSSRLLHSEPELASFLGYTLSITLLAILYRVARNGKVKLLLREELAQEFL